MEQETTLNNQIPTEKVYKDREVWAGTFLGGPLVAGYLIAKNFRAFGEADKARKTWVIAIIATVIIISIAFFAPYIDRIPNFFFTLVYTGIAYVLFQMYQGEKIKAYIKAGGKIHSWWRTLGVAVIGVVVTLVPIVGTAVMLEIAADANVITKTYATMKHEIAFDKSNISESEIDKLADGFRQTTFFDDEQQKFVYAKKVESNYEISISVNKSVTGNSETLTSFVELRNEIQKLFPNNKIIFNLVVDSLDNVVKRLE
ncbi:MAG: hypothetical protein M3367_02250 [Acidobacteriota bacterium]|nr:hypothetical protein [Acidobacteriota bacterium]